MIQQTIFIDAARYGDAKALHLALKMMLDLPDYYGCNADALYDCLSERKDFRLKLCILSEGEGETALALRKVIRVVEDLEGKVNFL